MSVPEVTIEENITTAGQRRINLIWEITQSVIALTVVIANIVVGIGQGLGISQSDKEHPFVLSSSLFLIIGFYFSRTNHAAIGGIGKKPVSNYQGR